MADLAADFAAWLEHRDLPPDTTLAELIELEREVARIDERFQWMRPRVTLADLMPKDRS